MRFVAERHPDSSTQGDAWHVYNEMVREHNQRAAKPEDDWWREVD
jgi:hypothetical protein